MALPISAGEILDVAKWAFDLWKSCKAAKGKFEQVSKEVYGMRAVIEIARLHCKSPSSIINHVDDGEKTLRRQLGVYIQNCKKALSEAEALLERYKRMSMPERIRRGWGGSVEVADLVSDLSSFTTQLNSSLTLSGVGVVNANVLEGFTATLKGIDWIEEALEKNDGDEKVAVKEVMQDSGRTGVSREEAKMYHDIIESYAREVCLMENLLPTRRAQTPDLSRGRDPDPNLLDVAPAAPCRMFVNSSPSGEQVKYQKGPYLGRPGGKKPGYTLECWLVQVKSTKALFVSFQISKKEKQTRGQWKLREIAKQFEASSQASQLANDHELVNWVLQDRKKEEKNKDFTWYPHAAKIESKNMLYLGVGVEEQAMIVIKRQTTPEAQRKFSKKPLFMKKGAPVEKVKPGKEQPQTEKGQRKDKTPKGDQAEGKGWIPSEGKPAGMKPPERKGQPQDEKPQAGKGHPPGGKPEAEKLPKVKGQRQGGKGQQEERKGQRHYKKQQVKPGQRQEETPEDEAKGMAKPSTSKQNKKPCGRRGP